MADYVCIGCGRTPPVEARLCPICTADVGYPNVRAARRRDQVEALEKRLADSMRSADARGANAEVANFLAATSKSDAVMNRSLGALHSWLNEASPLLVTFHNLRRAGARISQDNGWDQQRISAENTVSPLYYEELHPAALTLNGQGMTYYGPYSVILSEDLIAFRSTVFEENPFLFTKRHRVISGQPAPPGYRAEWAERQKLAVAKLGARIAKGLSNDDFPQILMEQRPNDPDCDFVEVHVYGPIHHSAIKHVSGPVPAEPVDRPLWKQAKRRLEAIGATWNEV